MEAGKLNRRLRIEQRGEATDEGGSVIDGWTEVATVWANVRTLNGREFAVGGGQASQVTASIRIRYRTDLTAGMRAICDGIVFNIVAVLPDVARREHVDLACTSGVNLG